MSTIGFVGNVVVGNVVVDGEQQMKAFHLRNWTPDETDPQRFNFNFNFKDSFYPWGKNE